MYKAIYSELNQARVRYFQLSHAVEFFSYLHIMQITSEEIHDRVILMKQISLHICIIHLVTETLLPMLLPAKQIHLAVIIGIQRWVYLPNRSMAATVSEPSGRINRRLRRIFSQSCPLAMAEHIISSEASLKRHLSSPSSPTLSQNGCQETA